MQTTSHVLQYTKDSLKTCPTDRYLLVNQPGVTSADLLEFAGCTMPSLCRAGDDTRTKGKYVVSELVGTVKDMSAIKDTGLASYIKGACAKENKHVTIDELDLAPLAKEDRSGAFAQNDATLSEKIEAVMAHSSYTILFLSTPGERTTYEVDFEDPVKMDIKRHFQGSNEARKKNETEWNKLPLFEKYQFFTPGIFMGLIAAIVLFSILGVGIKALASLEVPYGAFEKDMGPAAQKKQQ